MKLRCLLGHKWQKLGGMSSMGSGRFEQQYVCERCKKVKNVIG